MPDLPLRAEGLPASHARTAGPDDDASLLRRYAHEHSEAAFAQLVRRRIDLVFSAALRRSGGNRHQAEEVVQAVFTRLAQNAAQLADIPRSARGCMSPRATPPRTFRCRNSGGCAGNRQP